MCVQEVVSVSELCEVLEQLDGTPARISKEKRCQLEVDRWRQTFKQFPRAEQDVCVEAVRVGLDEIEPCG